MIGWTMILGLLALLSILGWLIFRDRRENEPEGTFGDLAKLWRDEGGEGGGGR